MAARGFVEHAARNRARALRYIALYCVTFVPLGLLMLGIYPIFIGKAQYSLLADPLHYGVLFLPVVIGLSLFMLARNLIGLRREIEEQLDIRPVTEQEEPRFARIAEEAALLQGLRRPQFGVIEVPARNAMAIGATPGQRMIAVTRGLLDTLDDDELAAVFAHELAHFRAGDASLLALNHALMRTAVQMQVWNPLKVETNVHMKFQWPILTLAFLPVFLLAMIAGGFVTMMAWMVAKSADRGVRSARDHVADAEALRVTHFPEALESAIARCHGHGYFPGAERIEAMLFAGNSKSEGGTHPDPSTRFARIRELAGAMYMPGRSRRDTRTGQTQRVFATAPRAAFGKRGLIPQAARAASFAQVNQRRESLPREPGIWLAYAWAFDRKAYRDWHREMFDHLAWRDDDKRNLLGGTTEATLWVLGSLALSLWFHIAINPDLYSALEQMTGRHYLAAMDAQFMATFEHKAN